MKHQKMLIALIAVAVVVLTVSGFAVTFYPDQESRVLFSTGTLVIGNGGELYGFTVYKNMTNVHISGTFASNSSVDFVIGYVGQNLSGGIPVKDAYVAYYVWSSGNTTGKSISVSLPTLSDSQFDVVYAVGFTHGSATANSNGTLDTVEINVTTPIVLTYLSS